MRSTPPAAVRSATLAEQAPVGSARVKRDSWLALLASGALSVGLVACGGGTSDDQPKPQSTAIDAATAAAAGMQAASAAASGASAAEQQADTASAPDNATPTATMAVASVKIAAATTAAASVSKTPTSSSTSTGNSGSTTVVTSQALPAATAAVPATAISAVAPTATSTSSTSTTTTKAASATTAPTSAPCSYEAKTTFATNCGALMSAVMADGESVTFSNTRSGYAGSIKASCSAGTITWTEATCQATTQGQTQMAMATASTSTAPPDLTKLKAFTAKPPFSVATKSGTKRVILGIYGTNDDVARTHDFVGPLVNPITARTNVMTLQTTALVSKAPTFTVISDTSTPPAGKVDTTGRYGLDAQGNLRVAYLANDPPSTDKLRTQVNSWPIPTRKTLTWDLSVRFAGLGAGEIWPATKFTVSPVLIWQLKSDPGFPPMGMLIDVDPENPTKALQLTFFQRLSNVAAYSRRWVVGGIDPNAFSDFIIQAIPDDREPLEGGIGMLKVWMNGKLLLSTTGRNLIADLPDVNRWCFGLYLTAESVASPTPRYTTWRRARMLTEGGI